MGIRCEFSTVPPEFGDYDMSGGVWISSILSNENIGKKQGLRTKFRGEEWEPARFEIPVTSDAVLANLRRYTRGHAMAIEEFPESAAVWNNKRFSKTSDIFAIGGFFAVKLGLAEILSRFDFGEGGLTPFTIYQADLVTPYPEEYFLLNFGAVKNTFLPEQSKNVAKFAIDHRTRRQIWEVRSWHEDDDVALSSSALAGPDLWFEELIENKIFLSGDLTSALQEAGLDEDWRLKRCRVLGEAA